jgi:hypothetical protein
MFESIILSKKPKKIDEYGNVEKVLLTEKTLDTLDGVQPLSYTLVKDGEQSRPDLVSLRVYGSDDHQDEICKANGISNPFSIEMNNSLVIPQLVSFSRNILNRKNDDSRDEKVQDFRISFKDVDDRKSESSIQKFNRAFDKQESELQQNGSGLPPTVADFGDKQFIVKGGRVIFAPNIGKCVTNENQPISKGELVSKLIKNRLLG